MSSLNFLEITILSELQISLKNTASVAMFVTVEPVLEAYPRGISLAPDQLETVELPYDEKVYFKADFKK